MEVVKLKFIFLIYIFATLFYYVDLMLNKESVLAYVQDPRKNSSFYDLIVSENQNYGSIIGYVNDILITKNRLILTKPILKYKLIYYSPQIIPSSSFTSQDVSQVSISSDPLFTVDPINGSIAMRIPSNEETLEYLCQKRVFCSCYSCIFSLNIIYSTENKISTESIRVFIDDHNDHAPQFYTKFPELIVNVSESSQIGDYFKLYNAGAYDLDAYYNEVSYYLSDRDITSAHDKTEQRSNLFEVAKVDPDSNDLYIVLKIHLDYESIKQYEFYLIAKDNGNANQLKNSKRLIVNVMDENDNSPLCEKSLFIESVKENKIFKNFLQIRATDLDSGVNGKLQYSIEPSPTGFHSELFHIDKYTGWLSIKQPLDYEKKPYYDLIIKVNDSNTNNSFTAFCSSRINVVDLNDNPAKMKIIKYLNESIQRGYYSLNTMSDDSISNEARNELDSFYQFEINLNYELKNQIEFYENNQPDLVLALIRVFDYDTISNYKFSIQSATNSQEDTSMFEIRMSDRSNREYELIGLKSFDSEYIQNYRLKITLYDLEELGDYKENTKLMLSKKPNNLNDENNFSVFLFERVRVLDLNDNGPQFLKKFHELKVKENLFNIGLNLNKNIEVFDLDTSEQNSKLQFRIFDRNNLTSNVQDRLYINDSSSNYPVIFLKKPFDYESDGSHFEFILAAFDCDNLTDSTIVSIKIEDTNDNAPIFMNENTTLVIKENMQINSFIGQVIAIDKDSAGPNSDISFKILFDNLRNLFKVYKSGVISNKVVFDREIQSYYNLKIEAYDNGQPVMSKVGTFIVKIEDENDNKPTFVYPNENVRYMHFKMPNLKAFPDLNSTLVRLFDVKAIDLDENDNGKVSFYIQDSLNLLTINKVNGSIYIDYQKMNVTTVKEFNEFRKIISVHLTANDSGTPQLSSSINFTFYLNYDSYELPMDVLKAIQTDLRMITNKSSQTKYDPASSYDTITFNSNKSSSFIQMISNSVLIVILMVILMIMVFIACFLFITMFKRDLKNKKNQSLKKKVKSYKGPQERSSCFTKIKSFLKAHCRICGNKQKQNLTVKDASSNDFNSNLATIEPILTNSFKVTIKNGEEYEAAKLKIKQEKSNKHLTNSNTIILNQTESFEEFNAFNAPYNDLSKENQNLGGTNYDNFRFKSDTNISMNQANSMLNKNSASTSSSSYNNTTNSINILNSSDTYSSCNISTQNQITTLSKEQDRLENQKTLSNLPSLYLNPNYQTANQSLPCQRNDDVTSILTSNSFTKNSSSYMDDVKLKSDIEPYSDIKKQVPGYSESTKESYSSNNFNLNILNTNSISNQSVTDNTLYSKSFKCKIVPYSANFNENINSNSIKRMLKPMAFTNCDEEEIIVKDDKTANSTELLQNLLQKFEKFYNNNGTVSNENNNNIFPTSSLH